MLIKYELTNLLLSNFKHTPTSEQRRVLERVADFLLSPSQQSVFLLRGYAGTGKTSLLAALVETLLSLHRKVVLLAPTGRAAKVFAHYSGHPAFTIHKKIYRRRTFVGESTPFDRNINLCKHTLFIIDEASMIANERQGETSFGTGRLLDDLVQFVYAEPTCRLMLVGDTAQLPPVGETESPALQPEYLEAYALTVFQDTLTQVVRQTDDSGILWNATMLRQCLTSEQVFDFPRVRLQGFADVCMVSGGELIETLEESYAQCGLDDTLVITRSNKRANIYNQGIRARILDYEEFLVSGDRLFIAKNNYHWVTRQPDGTGMEFIANGDVATVVRYRAERSLYGLRFADVTLRFADYDDFEVEATVLLDTLQSEAPALDRESYQRLFQYVWDDYPEITVKRERFKRVQEDAYYNALQVKYAYATTCHKAQGGQWRHVYVDVGYLTEESLSPDYFRWLYTAFTRATEKLYLVNWPSSQCEV